MFSNKGNRKTMQVLICLALFQGFVPALIASSDPYYSRCATAQDQPINSRQLAKIEPLNETCFVTQLPTAGFWMIEIRAQDEAADTTGKKFFEPSCQPDGGQNLRVLEWSQYITVEALAPGRYTYCLDLQRHHNLSALTLEVGNAFLVGTKEPDPRVIEPDPDPACSQIQGISNPICLAKIIRLLNELTALSP